MPLDQEQFLTSVEAANRGLVGKGLISRSERIPLVELKLSRVFKALEAYPTRKQYIKELRTEPSDGAPSSASASLARLLRLVAPHLKRLDIVPLPGSGATRQNARSHFTIACHSVPLPRLTHLRFAFTLDYDSWDRILPWRMDVPMLQDLEFGLNSGTWENDPFSLGQRSERRPFPRLQRLTFDDLSHDEADQSLRMLAILLRLAPNLAELKLRGVWQPQSQDAALRLIGRAGKLKSAQLLECREGPVQGGVEFADMGTRRLPLKVREAVVEMSWLSEIYDLRLKVRLAPILLMV